MAFDSLLGRSKPAPPAVAPAAPAAAAVAPLSESDEKILADAEAVIGKHVLGYARVGQALTVIRDRQLYRKYFGTFEEYVSQKWKMDRTHAYRLMQASEVSARLSPTGDTPPTESHARPLTRLDPQHQVDAWQDAKAMASGGPVTVALVEAAAAKRRPKSKTAKKLKPIRLKVPGGSIIIQPNRAFSSVAEILQHGLDQVKRQAAA